MRVACSAPRFPRRSVLHGSHRVGILAKTLGGELPCLRCWQPGHARQPLERQL